MKNPTKKEIAAYRKSILEILCEACGETEPIPSDKTYPYLLQTTAGPLHVSIQDDWVATRFDDVNLARGKIAGMNPYSGKWNFHGNNPQIIQLFRRDLLAIAAT